VDTAASSLWTQLLPPCGHSCFLPVDTAASSLWTQLPPPCGRSCILSVNAAASSLWTQLLPVCGHSCFIPVDTAASSLWTQLLFFSGHSCSQRQLLFVLVSGAAAPSLSIQVKLLPLSLWTQLSALVRKFNRVFYAKRFLKCFRNSISSPFPSFLHNSMTTHCQAIAHKKYLL
jgi:hypothetical protein